jgi:hypothetical protein
MVHQCPDCSRLCYCDLDDSNNALGNEDCLCPHRYADEDEGEEA